MQYGTHSADFPRRLDRIRYPPGHGPRDPDGFPDFSRAYEAEADKLGLEYMYKAGYDPTCFVDFFEKVQSQEKRKPGTMSKVFSTHPPTDDRIKAAQKNHSEIPERETGVRGQHERIQRCESPRHGHAQSPRRSTTQRIRPADAAPKSERPDRSNGDEKAPQADRTTARP